MAVIIRPTEDGDHDVVHQMLTERWTGPDIMLDHQMVDASRLPGYVAFDGDDLVGLVTLIKREKEWEILTLDLAQPLGRGGKPAP
ncbi:hypothetical protein QW131_16725 [Roseibium salinum]|nr:hypothetical protein [Roseibium salinum]